MLVLKNFAIKLNLYNKVLNQNGLGHVCVEKRFENLHNG